MSASLRSFASSLLVLASLAGCSGSTSDVKDPFGRDPAPTTTDTGGTTPSPTAGARETDSPGATETPETPAAGDDDPNAPLRIKNVSFTLSGSTGGGWQGVDVTFTVEKKTGLAIDRVQEVSVTFDGEKRTFPITCAGTWFELYASRVITLNVDDSGASSQVALGCGASSVTNGTTKPWGESVTIELRGLLSDATPWRAKGTGSR